MPHQINVTVVGAGVIGLTTALLLSKDKKYSITVVAKHMPGDYDIEYASPWAGANFLPVGKAGSAQAKFEIATWKELERLARDVAGAGIHFQDTAVYNRTKDANTATGKWFAELLKTDAWFKDVVPNFRVLPESELRPSIDSATAFTSVCINTAIYLPWLVSQCLTAGVIFKRHILTHLSQAFHAHHTGHRSDYVINCIGLSARTLPGLNDESVYPARGQIVLVRNTPDTMASMSGTDDGTDEATYIMHRAAGGGTILGGSFQQHNWESQVDPNLATRIMKRCVDLCPELTGGRGIEHLSVVRHGVGLRPLREGGPRVEADARAEYKGVVHQYGHGGYGYQTSYGSAQEAVRVLDEMVEKDGKRSQEMAKL